MHWKEVLNWTWYTGTLGKPLEDRTKAYGIDLPGQAKYTAKARLLTSALDIDSCAACHISIFKASFGHAALVCLLHGSRAHRTWTWHFEGSSIALWVTARSRPATTNTTEPIPHARHFRQLSMQSRSVADWAGLRLRTRGDICGEWKAD